jgi:AbrB family looped-hinge helix DNA binding protein
MDTTRVRVDQSGRIIIPATQRSALNLEPGAELSIAGDEHGLVLLPERNPTGPDVAPGRAQRRRPLPSVAGSAPALPDQRNPWCREPFPLPVVHQATTHHDPGTVERFFRHAMTGLLPQGRTAESQAEGVWMLLDHYPLHLLCGTGVLDRGLAPLAERGWGRVIVDDATGMRVCTAPEWRFPDDSRLFHVCSSRGMPVLVCVGGSGLGPFGMRDHPLAVEAALRSDRPGYVEMYVSVHGQLPRLDRPMLLRALRSPSAAIRTAAITSLATTMAGQAVGPGAEGGVHSRGLDHAHSEGSVAPRRPTDSLGDASCGRTESGAGTHLETG